MPAFAAVDVGNLWDHPGMLHAIVEGEPGIFPDPVSRLLRAVGGLFGRGKDRTPPPEDETSDRPGPTAGDEPSADGGTRTGGEPPAEGRSPGD